MYNVYYNIITIKKVKKIMNQEDSKKNQLSYDDIIKSLNNIQDKLFKAGYTKFGLEINEMTRKIIKGHQAKILKKIGELNIEDNKRIFDARKKE